MKNEKKVINEAMEKWREFWAKLVIEDGITLIPSIERNQFGEQATLAPYKSEEKQIEMAKKILKDKTPIIKVGENN